MLNKKVKEIIIECLELEDIDVDDIIDDAPLFSAYDETEEGLGLDSVDSLDLIVAVKKEFGVRITDENMKVLSSINTLVAFIEEEQKIGV